MPFFFLTVKQGQKGGKLRASTFNLKMKYALFLAAAVVFVKSESTFYTLFIRKATFIFIYF